MRWLRQMFCAHRCKTGWNLTPGDKGALRHVPKAILWRCDYCGKYTIEDARN